MNVNTNKMSDETAKPVTAQDLPGLTAFALLWRLQLNVPLAANPNVALAPVSVKKRPLRVLSAGARLTSSRTVGRRALALIEGSLEFCVYPRHHPQKNKDIGVVIQDLGRALAVAVAQELRSRRVKSCGPYNDVLCREGFAQLLAPVADDETRQFAFHYEVAVVDLGARQLQFPGLRAPVRLSADSCTQVTGHYKDRLNVCVSLGDHQPQLLTDIADLYPIKELRYEAVYDSRQHALSVAHLEHLDAWLASISLTATMEKGIPDPMLDRPHVGSKMGSKVRRLPAAPPHNAPM